MTTSDSQHDQFHYNFFRKELWLDRFASVYDVIGANFGLWRTIMADVPGLSSSLLIRTIGEAETEGGVSLGQLRDAITRISTLDDGSITAGEAPFDSDFEIKQLLNLYTLNFTLYNFEEVLLQGTVRALPFESEVTLPPVHLIRDSFRYVAMDAEIIQRALVQRRRERDSANHSIMSAQGRALLVTDKLAVMALAPVQHLLPASPLIPISYLSQRTHIHRVPYSARAVLVGIRYDGSVVEINRRFASAEEALRTDHPPLPAFELMAIPHEVGHYVYHHAQLDPWRTFASLSESLQVHPYHAWCEELFADLYGCAIGGPLAALGLQALLAFGDDEMLEDDDGEHPTSLVRPFILTDMLRRLSDSKPDRYRLHTVADALDQNWITFLRRRGYPVSDAEGEGRTVTLPNGKRIAVGPLLAEVSTLLDTFFDPLLEALDSFDPPVPPPTGTLSTAIPWSTTDTGDLTRYDREMAALTTSTFARQRVPQHPLNSYERSPYRTLQDMLDHWGDSGPHGTGPHAQGGH